MERRLSFFCVRGRFGLRAFVIAVWSVRSQLLALLRKECALVGWWVMLLLVGVFGMWLSFFACGDALVYARLALRFGACARSFPRGRGVRLGGFVGDVFVGGVFGKAIVFFA
ncbi:MAG: hypothetical protein IIU02_11100, partial [Treponema sp.]|uniref:hypothetical protein n=1 Tax=Treponema sp. TaxID=166 RepID=UPI00257D7106